MLRFLYFQHSMTRGETLEMATLVEWNNNYLKHMLGMGWIIFYDCFVQLVYVKPAARYIQQHDVRSVEH